jgi:hypothetical protein
VYIFVVGLPQLVPVVVENARRGVKACNPVHR